MELEKSVKKQTENTIEYYKNLDNIEQVPIDILRAMYKDLLENSIPKKKIEDKITYWNKRLNEDERLDFILKDKSIINELQELLEE